MNQFSLSLYNFIHILPKTRHFQTAVKSTKSARMFWNVFLSKKKKFKIIENRYCVNMLGLSLLVKKLQELLSFFDRSEISDGTVVHTRTNHTHHSKIARNLKYSETFFFINTKRVGIPYKIFFNKTSKIIRFVLCAIVQSSS